VRELSAGKVGGGQAINFALLICHMILVGQLQLSDNNSAPLTGHTKDGHNASLTDWPRKQERKKGPGGQGSWSVQKCQRGKKNKRKRKEKKQQTTGASVAVRVLVFI